MTYVNKHDTNGTCSKRGESAVTRFDEVIESMGGESLSASKSDDIERHVDKFVILYDKEFTVDVKAAKSTNRGGDIVIDEVWVEYKNVNGHDGWLLGEEDFVAFETTKHNFVMVSRSKLLDFCDKKIDKSGKPVKFPEQALYKLYRRDKRNDLISRIKLDDVMGLDPLILRKKESKNGK